MSLDFHSTSSVSNHDLGDESDVHAKCAIFAIYNGPVNAAQLTYYGLHAMQHRGQESAGIVTLQQDGSGSKMFGHKGLGLVLDVFNDPAVLEKKLVGRHAVGHTRYSTAGSNVSNTNIQPFKVTYKNGNIALAHNGNLSNAAKIRNRLVSRGTLFQGTSDSEQILHLISQSSSEAQIDQILDALGQCQGAFSLVILTEDCLYGIRDPNGFRPLVLGKYDSGSKCGGMSYCLASETCAFDLIGARYLREIEPGEIIRIDREGCISGNFKSWKLPQTFGISPCIFEYIYFSRPDSIVFGQSVHLVRQLLGAELAREHPVPVPFDDTKVVVIAVPDSSNTAALGYVQECQKLGFPCEYDIGLIRNHYVGRTFISPNQDARELKVRCKFNTLSHVIKDNIVVLVDDSIVRGTTSKLLIKMVRHAGAKEVHFRVSSPPVVSPCFYGMDFPSYSELLANTFSSVDEMTQYLGTDSLAYLSIAGLKNVMDKVGSRYGNFCNACFTNEYPVPIDSEKEAPKPPLAKFEW